jgi:hypothetical protein
MIPLKAKSCGAGPHRTKERAEQRNRAGFPRRSIKSTKAADDGTKGEFLKQFGEL